MAVASLTKFTLNKGAFDRLTRSRQGPIGRDLQKRGLRVTARMKANATGSGGGPQIRTGTLHSAISFLRFGTDTKGLLADIGPQGQRVVKRGWNYAILLEGPGSVNDPAITLQGGPFGTAVRRPFMARSLDAAR